MIAGFNALIFFRLREARAGTKIRVSFLQYSCVGSQQSLLNIEWAAWTKVKRSTFQIGQQGGIISAPG